MEVIPPQFQHIIQADMAIFLIKFLVFSSKKKFQTKNTNSKWPYKYITPVYVGLVMDPNSDKHGPTQLISSTKPMEGSAALKL